MLRLTGAALAAALAALGVVHLVVGRSVFAAPTQDGAWFLSAGLLAIVGGIANLAPVTRAGALAHLAAGASAAACLALAAVLLAASDGAGVAPRAWTLGTLAAALLFVRGLGLAVRERS
jgi:peptidoglycan/LPS O-acetylase OafA/YrhL